MKLSPISLAIAVIVFSTALIFLLSLLLSDSSCDDLAIYPSHANDYIAANEEFSAQTTTVVRSEKINDSVVTFLDEEGSLITKISLYKLGENGNVISLPILDGTNSTLSPFERIVAVAPGHLPIAVILGSSSPKPTVIRIPFCSSAEFQLVGQHYSAALQETLFLGYDFSAATGSIPSIKWESPLLSRLPPAELTVAYLDSLPGLHDWFKSQTKNSIREGGVQSFPLFDLPRKVAFNAGSLVLLPYLPIRLSLTWKAFPSSIEKLGWDSKDAMSQFAYNKQGDVTFDIGSKVQFCNSGEFQINRSEVVKVALLRKPSATIVGRLVQPSFFQCALQSIAGEVSLRKLSRNEAGDLLATVGIQKAHIMLDGSFSFQGVSSGEYSILGQVKCNDLVALFSWSGTISEGENRDLHDLMCVIEQRITATIFPMDRFGSTFPAATIWPGRHAPHKKIFFRANLRDHSTLPFGLIEVEIGRPVTIFGLDREEFSFSFHDGGRAGVFISEGFISAPFGTQEQVSGIERREEILFGYGVTTEVTNCEFEISGVSPVMESTYSIIILDPSSGKIVFNSTLPSSVDEDSSNIAKLNVPLPEGNFWIAIYISNPSVGRVDQPDESSYFGYFEIMGSNNKIQLALERHTDVNGKIVKGPKPRKRPVSVIGLFCHGTTNQKFPIPIPVTAQVSSAGTFALPGLPTNAHYSIRGMTGGELNIIDQILVVFID